MTRHTHTYTQTHSQPETKILKSLLQSIGLISVGNEETMYVCVLNNERGEIKRHS